MLVDYIYKEFIAKLAVEYLQKKKPELVEGVKHTDLPYFIDKVNRRDPETFQYVQTWKYYEKQRGKPGEWIEFMKVKVNEINMIQKPHVFNDETLDGYDVSINSKMIIQYLLNNKNK